ncbi:hypothetical protein Tco_0287870 [Tanacetum coccineum]
MWQKGRIQAKLNCSFYVSIRTFTFSLFLMRIQTYLLGQFESRYGYIKNHKKTVKNVQAHQKSTKRSQRIKAEARKVKP